MAWGHGQAREAVGGDGFDLWPQGRKMKAVANDHGGQAKGAGLFHEHRQAGFEGEQGVGVVGIDADDGRAECV
ncbi:hypothetical protein D3C72_2134590 [compost metagenome]